MENMSNKFTAIKDRNGTYTIYLNDIKIERVLDFSYSKNSAGNPAELTIKLDVDEVLDVFTRKDPESQ